MIKINGKEVPFQTGETVLNVCRENGIFVDSPCSGQGRCGKCRCTVSGDVSPMGAHEEALLSPADIAAGVRLACYCKALGDADVTVKSDAYEEIKTDFDVSLIRPEAPASGEKTGLAVDIGTTTLAMYFCDLESGKILRTFSQRNDQREFGADVISRIAAVDEDPDALKRMRQSVANQINHAVGQFGGPVDRAVIVGNTTMLHLLTALNPSGIARSPFTPQSLFGTEYAGAQLGLKVKGSVFLAPCVSAYVGGDITAGINFLSLQKREITALFVDIGTNGEMALVHGGKIFCCSTAAGPAFEGAQIECGSGSVAGAVNRVWMLDGKVGHGVIGKGEPTSICGSGIVDAMALLCRGGLIDETGLLTDEDKPGVIEDDRLIIADKVWFSQKDIRQVQLAKAAIAAGISTLLHHAGIKAEEVDEALIAGGFGSNISFVSAADIGLLPKELAGKYHAVGNAAGAGAVAALLSASSKESLERIPDACEYIELSTDSFFADEYIDQMYFPV